jgi:hypothetical protein
MSERKPICNISDVYIGKMLQFATGLLPQAFSRRSLSTASRAPRSSSFVGAMLTDTCRRLAELYLMDVDASGRNAVTVSFKTQDTTDPYNNNNSTDIEGE